MKLTEYEKFCLITMLKLEYLLFIRRQRSLEGIKVFGVRIKPVYQLHSLQDLYKSDEEWSVFSKAEMLRLKNLELSKKLTA